MGIQLQSGAGKVLHHVKHQRPGGSAEEFLIWFSNMTHVYPQKISLHMGGGAGEEGNDKFRIKSNSLTFTFHRG